MHACKYIYIYIYVTTAVCNHSPSTTTPPLIDYSLTLSQRLTFRNRANIFGFAVTVFVTILFVFIGALYHRNSQHPQLIFISRKTNLWFYVCAIFTLFLSILMTALYKTDEKYKKTNETFLGILISLTMASINLASIINVELLISRVLTICITIVMIVVYFINLSLETYSLSTIVQVLTVSEAILLLLISLISKTAQIQLCFLCMLIWWSFAANYDEIFFSFFWYSMICIGISLISIFVFSEKHTTELRSMFMSLFGGFLSLFDMNTDFTILILWISGGLYFWVIMQLVFILAGTFYSAFYIDDYYFITDSTHRKTKSIPRLFWGRMFTLFGLGRLYHAIVGWDELNNKDMEIANRALKLWEMVFESFPTITLQFWVSLYTDFDINIVLSLFVSFASISFTFFRIVYSDHSSDSREEEIVIGQRVHDKQKTSELHFDAENNYIMKARSHTMMSVHVTKQKEPTSIYTMDDNNNYCSKLYEILSNKSGIIENFICCFPLKLIYDYMDRKQEPSFANDSWTAKLKDYFIMYIWIISDLFCRIFPILVCARIQNDYLQFVAVMIGLTIYEFFFYYFMLIDNFKHLRSSSYLFWTLYTSKSFCLLSTMYLLYLPCNVMFNRLICEHICRMIIQLLFMIVAMYLQNLYFGSWFAFFDHSIKFFFAVITMNIIMTIYIAKKYNKMDNQIADVINYEDNNINAKKSIVKKLKTAKDNLLEMVESFHDNSGQKTEIEFNAKEKSKNQQNDMQNELNSQTTDDNTNINMNINGDVHQLQQQTSLSRLDI